MGETQRGMGERLKIILQLFRKNWWTFLGFELLYKLLAAAAGIPLLAFLGRKIMKLAGYSYLTLENFRKFLKNPLILCAFVLFFVIILIYQVYDVSALVFLTAHSWQGQKVTLLQTARFAGRTLCRLTQKGNRGLLGWMAVLLPFLDVGTAACALATVMLPNFVKSGLQEYRFWLTLAVLAALILIICLLHRLYSFHYFALEQCDAREAARRSRELSRGYRLRDALALAATQIGFYFCYFLFAALGILLMLCIAKLLSRMKLFQYVYTSAIWGLLMMILLIVSAAGMPVSYGCVNVLYVLHKRAREEPVRLDQPEIRRLPYKKRVHLAETVLLAGALLACAVMIYRSSSEYQNPQIEYLHTMEVTAHRGSSAFFPENTMAAFEGAAEFGADWIELDVQQSRDGQIFVMHDKSFYRTTGDKHYSWELDYEDIAKLDAGSYFSDTFAGERIPLLSEVIAWAKEKEIRLNIEIKPGSHDENMEELVVDLILEQEYVDSCVVSSQQYSALERVKGYNPEIQTVYVMSLAYGNINRLTAADGFSMEAGNVTPGMVSRIHNAGKQIYAWTVNSRKTINRMIDLQVDNLITDRVSLAQECIYESKTSSVVQQYAKFLRSLT